MAELVRVQQATPYTPQQTWTEDGVVVDPGAVTVQVTRADGTEVIPAGTGANGTGATARGINLTAAHTALLDTLTVTWTSPTKGTLKSRVEVVGGFLFSITEARQWAPLNNATNYPTDRLVQMRTLVEDAFEHACEVAFVPRYTLEQVEVRGYTWYPKQPRVTAIRSVTVDGSPVTGSTLGADGSVTFPSWYTRWQTVTVGYEHGYQFPPPRVSRAALGEARYRLISGNSPTDDRAVRLDTEAGSYALQQPGRGGMLFYLPESDAVVQEYSLRAGIY